MHPKSFVSNFWGAVHMCECGGFCLYCIHFREFGGREVVVEVALEVGDGVGADCGVFVEVVVIDYF